jgi:hypothetical protein
VLFLVFFLLLFAFCLAFRTFLLIIFLELADFDLNVVSFNSQSNGQFGGASLQFRWCIQDLISISGFQYGSNVVAIRLPLQTFSLGAHQFRFEVITISVSLKSNNEAVSIALAARIVQFDTLFEREFSSRLSIFGALA